jgi:hypothetical protein
VAATATTGKTTNKGVPYKVSWSLAAALQQKELQQLRRKLQQQQQPRLCLHQQLLAFTPSRQICCSQQ